MATGITPVITGNSNKARTPYRIATFALPSADWCNEPVANSKLPEGVTVDGASASLNEVLVSGRYWFKNVIAT